MTMIAADILEQLGFTSDAPHWISGERRDDILFPLRRAVLEETDDSTPEPQTIICGSYVFQTSAPDANGQSLLAPRPAVHIVQVATPAQAQAVRKKLWNLGTAPFLILLLPNRVLVYNGFNYQEKKTGADDPDLIHDVPLSSADIALALRDFHARSIDSGLIWKTQADNLTPEKRVDQKLLKNLQQLGDELKKRFALTAATAHALIGKFIYLWYLRDRNILSDQWIADNDLAPWPEITGRQTRASQLSELVNRLETRFNGRVFPLDFAQLGQNADAVTRYVASVFRGDDAESGQLAFDFKVYDFSCIPVELLSAIYEQFLRAEGRGQQEGAVYTREFVADYLLAEINSQKPLQVGMKILDPACGSGVFLVLAFRRLIERQLHEKGVQTLPPQEISALLQSSIFGVELIEDACHVAEFSLILMLLSYVEPPELHANAEFRFPALHGRNIIQGDFFDPTLALFAGDHSFDWIVGNPSWEKVKSASQPLAASWISQHLKTRPVGNYNLAEAFTWRVAEVLAPEGCVGLLIKATSLTNKTSYKYRRAFFRANEVRRVTNFANLAYILFAGRADVPAASVVFLRASDVRSKPDIVHYGPFAANQALAVSNNQGAWSLTIYEEEVQWVSAEGALSGEGVVWKRALWGNYRDEKTLKSFGVLFDATIGEMIEKRDWKLYVGIQIRNIEELNEQEREDVEYCAELNQLDYLNVNPIKGKFLLSIPQGLLSQIPLEQQYIRKRGGKVGLEVAQAPHLYWSVATAAYSDLNFVLHLPQKAMSAPQEDAEYLRAISLFLNSSVGRYLTFFNLIQWGIDRNQFTPTEPHSIPIPRLAPNQIVELCRVHRELDALQTAQSSLFEGDVAAVVEEVEIRQRVDEAIERVLDVPEYLGTIARDFVSVRLKLNKGARSSSASERASVETMKRYADYLREILDGFGRGRVHHRIEISQDASFTVCSVEICSESSPIEPIVRVAVAPLVDSDLWKSLAQQQSQWVYVQRSLRVFEGRKVNLWKTSRLLDWTRAQAIIDSDAIIADVLAAKETGAQSEVSR